MRFHAFFHRFPTILVCFSVLGGFEVPHCGLCGKEVTELGVVLVCDYTLDGLEIETPVLSSDLCRWGRLAFSSLSPRFLRPWFRSGAPKGAGELETAHQAGAGGQQALRVATPIVFIYGIVLV